jgi:single-strand DNA-binding protein
MYINKVFIYGNLTRDPEVRALPSGNKVASFGVATNRSWKDTSGNKQEAAEFHNVVVFGKSAETAALYLKKGRPVFIEGRIQTRSWEAQDGQKKSRTEIIAERFQFGPSGAPSSNQGQPKEDAEPNNKSAGEAIEYPAEEINADDIPF